MIRRFESQAPWWSPRLPAQNAEAPRRDHGRNRARGWLLVALITALALAWTAYRWLGRPAWFAWLAPERQQLIVMVETAALATLAIVWAGLWWHAQRREQKRRLAGEREISLPELFALSPAAFERYVGGLFAAKGYRVRRRGGSGDQGVDLELADGLGRRAIVQCKRYQHTVGADVVRELFGTLVHEGVNHAFLVTTAEISESARTWAAGKPLTLIDGYTLVAIAARLDES